MQSVNTTQTAFPSTHSPTFHDILENSSLESMIYRPTSTHELKDHLTMFTIAYLQPNTLNSHKINADLWVINSHRAPVMFNQQPIHPLDVGMEARLAVMGPYRVSAPQHEMPSQIEYIQTNPQIPMEYGAHAGGVPPLGSIPVNDYHSQPVRAQGCMQIQDHGQCLRS